MGKHLLFKKVVKHFANNKGQTVESFCNWGNDGVAPVIRYLGGLEGEWTLYLYDRNLEIEYF